MNSLSLSNVAALAKRLDRGILFFDLEATTFRGRPNFGLTEVAAVLVQPTGVAVEYGHLINPERDISAQAQALTGITADMVQDKETWGRRYAKHFQDVSSMFWMAGFNIKSFDLHALKDMGERYGYPISNFEHVLDVRDLYLKITQSKSRRGTLSMVAQHYGVTVRPDVHRARADVHMTVEILNEMIASEGLEAVVNFLPVACARPPLAAREAATHSELSGKPLPSSARPLSVRAIAEYVRGKSHVSLQELARVFVCSERTLSFEVGKAIDERAVEASVFAHPPTQEWLTCALIEDVSASTLKQGKLKPLFEALRVLAPDHVDLDYVQLRAALAAAGLFWSSRKRD